MPARAPLHALAHTGHRISREIDAAIFASFPLFYAQGLLGPIHIAHLQLHDFGDP
jgi:hypothetical protein